MLDFINLSLAKPSGVKWALALTTSAAKAKSLKSFSLTVIIGYLLKKGTTLLMLSGKVFITKSQAKPFDLI